MLSWASRALGVVGRGLQGVGRGRPAVWTGVWRASSSGGGDGRVRTDGPVVVSSPHSGVNIPDSVSVAEFVMDKLAKYGDKTALVSHSCALLLTNFQCAPSTGAESLMIVILFFPPLLYRHSVVFSHLPCPD